MRSRLTTNVLSGVNNEVSDDPTDVRHRELLLSTEFCDANYIFQHRLAVYTRAAKDAVKAFLHDAPPAKLEKALSDFRKGVTRWWAPADLGRVPSGMGHLGQARAAGIGGNEASPV